MQWARLLDRQCSDSFSDHKDSSKSKPIPALSLFFQKTREFRRTGTHLAAFVIDQAATTQVEHQPCNHLARRTDQPGDLLVSQAHARFARPRGLAGEVEQGAHQPPGVIVEDERLDLAMRLVQTRREVAERITRRRRVIAHHAPEVLDEEHGHTCRVERHRLIASPRFDRSASEGQLAEQITAIADRDNLLLPARRGSQNLDSPADNRIKMRRRIIRRVDRRPAPERAHNVRQFAQRWEAMRRAYFSLAHTRRARRHHCLPPAIFPRLNCYFFAASCHLTALMSCSIEGLSSLFSARHSAKSFSASAS